MQSSKWYEELRGVTGIEQREGQRMWGHLKYPAGRGKADVGTPEVLSREREGGCALPNVEYELGTVIWVRDL